jgi:4-amino-4-deoxy-L-arabinose transferase-like glycosyltransferase
MTSDPLPVILLLFALAIYLPGINWGIPQPTNNDLTHGWGNDDLVPLAPLAEMHNTFVVAKPDRNIAYPWFHYFLVGSAYSPYLVYLKLTGGISQPAPAYPFGLTDPIAVFRHLSWIGRTVTLLLAFATVLGAYFTGKYLWGRTAGLFSGLFTMLMFPMAYYARLGNLDVPVLGWTSLGLAVFALSLRNGLTVKRGAWFGALVALALATKTQAFGSFLLLAPVLLWLHLKSGNEGTLWRWTSRWAAPAAACLGCLITYVFASGIPVDPTRYKQHTAKLFLASTQIFYLRYPATLAGFAAHARDVCGYLVDVISWPVLIIAGLGVMLAIRKDRRSLVMVLSALGFFLMLLPVRFSKIHYLLPVALPLNLFAGYAIARGIKARAGVRMITICVAIVAIGFLLAETLDLTHDMIYDSRYAASNWLNQNTQAGDAMVYFGAGMGIPPMRADVEKIKVFQRRQALPSIQDRKPDLVLVMPLDFNEDRKRVEWRHGRHSIYSDYLPANVYEKLVDGSLGYRLVAQFQTPRLFPWLNRPFLSYATVNPPIQIFARADRAGEMQALQPWREAPYNPRFSRVRELTIDLLNERGQQVSQR